MQSGNQTSVPTTVSTLPLFSSSAGLNPVSNLSGPGTTAVKGLLQFSKRKILSKDADWPDLERPMPAPQPITDIREAESRNSPFRSPFSPHSSM